MESGLKTRYRYQIKKYNKRTGCLVPRYFFNLYRFAFEILNNQKFYSIKDMLTEILTLTKKDSILGLI